MIEDKELQALVEFSGTQPVLSVYLDTNLAHQPKEAVKLTFRECLKRLEERPAPADIQAVEKFLDLEYDWQGPGVAIFVSGDELWKTMPLPVAVTTQVYLVQRPYVYTLADVLDRLGKYAVVLVDREGGRFFAVALGKIQAETAVLGEEIKHQKQGGWAAARYQRHEGNTALHNLKQMLEMTQDFCQEHDCRRVVLAGSTEVLTQFKELMPKALRSQIIGEFAVDMEASSNDILSHSLDITAQADLEAENKLVTDVITATAKGGAGVIGLADTLYLLHQKRVHQLLVAENYRAPGYVCVSCGYTAAEHSAKCPFCGHEELHAIPDAVNRAIYKAIQTGAEVNIIRKNAELARAGGIAATLRY